MSQSYVNHCYFESESRINIPEILQLVCARKKQV